MKQETKNRKPAFESEEAKAVGMMATCNSCDHIIYEDENFMDSYRENGGYCRECSEEVTPLTPIHEEEKLNEWIKQDKIIYIKDSHVNIYAVPVIENDYPVAYALINSKITEKQAQANAALIADCPNMKKYIDYVRGKVGAGGVPYDYEDWKEVNKPDYE